MNEIGYFVESSLLGRCPHLVVVSTSLDVWVRFSLEMAVPLLGLRKLVIVSLGVQVREHLLISFFRAKENKRERDLKYVFELRLLIVSLSFECDRWFVRTGW